MRTDVAHLPDRFDGLPAQRINLLFDGSDLIDEAAWFYLPEISDDALKTSAGKCCRCFGAKILDQTSLVIIVQNRCWNVCRK